MQVIEPSPANDQVPVPVSAVPTPQPPERRRWTMSRSGLLRISLGLAILVAATAIYTPALLYTTSSEAILNARIITLGAPIDGQIAAPTPAEGTFVKAGGTLLKIQNPNVDNSHLLDLETARTRTATELAGANQLVKTLSDQLMALEGQLALYRSASIARLELAVSEAQAEAVVAASSAEEARTNFARKQALQVSNVISAADFDQAREAVRRSEANADRARLAVQRMQEELGAAKRGVYIGGDRNDVPYSQQRAEEYQVRRAEAVAQAKALTARLTQLDEQVADERGRVERLTAAQLQAPVSGVVWRPMVAAGSTVARNADMLTLIDCSQIYATASFSGRRFDDLRPGARGTVRVLDSGRDYTGTVVDVRAMERSAAEERFAAPLPHLGDRQILAIVRIDKREGLSSQNYCNVGRRVEVRFEDLRGPAIANAH